MSNNTKKQIKKRIENLKKIINHHRYLYHVLDRQEISDEVLDSLKKELFDLELKYPEFIALDSPTQRIGGAPLKEFKKIHHEAPMLSFNDAFSEQDMKNWLERVENYLGVKIKPEFYCELKIDGLAIELVYENGFLVQGSTRGDGLMGEDITQNLKTIEAIPLRLEKLEIRNSKLEIPLRLVVRGEVFIAKKEFERINKEQEQKSGKIFANPRNVAAGSVRQLDPKITANRKLDSFIYDIVSDLGQSPEGKPSASYGARTHEETHQMLKDFGFKTNFHNRKAESIEEVFKFRNYWGEEKHRGKLPYEIDGIVAIVNDNKIFKDAGVIGKAPRAAIAYKFSPKEAATIIEDIKIQVGRTGTLTPVAILKPLELSGTKISRATLHNFDQIKRLGLKIGDTVIISRAGDVIPQVVSVLKDLRTGKEKKIKIPDQCPIDGAKIIQEGVFYRCSNSNCGARNCEFLKHFVSRAAFNIRGLGGKILDHFLNEGLISDAADIFELKEEDILILPGFGEKSAENIVHEAISRKKITLPRFIYSLGILHIGEETALLLAKQFRIQNSEFRIKNLIKQAQNWTLEDLQRIRDIGPKVAQSIYDWFREERNIKFLEKLESVGVQITSDKRQTISDKLKNKTFVLTGFFESMSRDKAKEKIRELGGNASESVNKKTDYVVVGGEPGSKYERAKKLGVKILNEEEFLNLL